MYVAFSQERFYFLLRPIENTGIELPLQIVNPLTSFGCGPTASNSYVFAWTNAAQECKV